MTERNLALLRSVSQLKEALGEKNWKIANSENCDPQPAVETLNQNPLQNCDPEAELQNSDQLSNSHQSNSKMLSSEFLYEENDNLLNRNNSVHRDGEINSQKNDEKMNKMNKIHKNKFTNLLPRTKHLGPGEDVEEDVKSADVLNEVRLIL